MRMDIRSSLDGLKSLLGVNVPEVSAGQGKTPVSSSGSGLTSDHATLSTAGSEASASLNGSDVRPEKVASIQAALASGTYNVPPSAVASKMVDAMLGVET
jgi:negative regulator of flagellin synthesis FlgM